MENTSEAYEVPTLTEVGGYAELTRGGHPIGLIDGGPYPYSYSERWD